MEKHFGEVDAAERWPSSDCGPGRGDKDSAGEQCPDAGDKKYSTQDSHFHDASIS
jgi:hypothetical protein